MGFKLVLQKTDRFVLSFSIRHRGSLLLLNRSLYRQQLGFQPNPFTFQLSQRFHVQHCGRSRSTPFPLIARLFLPLRVAGGRGV